MFCHFPIRCPWSGMVLDWIDSWSLPSSLLSLANGKLSARRYKVVISLHMWKFVYSNMDVCLSLVINTQSWVHRKVFPYQNLIPVMLYVTFSISNYPYLESVWDANSIAFKNGFISYLSYELHCCTLPDKRCLSHDMLPLSGHDDVALFEWRR